MKCPHCNFITGKRQSAIIHILNGYHELIKPKCPFCEFIPENMEEAMTHFQYKHKTKTTKDYFDTKLKKFIKIDKENLILKIQKIRELEQTWYECPLGDYKAKNRELVEAHLANKHDIDIIWHECPHCGFKVKDREILDAHMAHKHDIGISWHECPHCDFKAITPSALKIHLADMHDLGVK